MANVPLPSDISYGFVVGRLLYAVADTAADPDPYPDGRPATGSVSFTPYETSVISTAGAAPSTGIIPTKIVSPLVDGYLTDDEKRRGIWLVAGLTYKVVIALTGSASIVFDLAVTSAATADSPIDLVKSIPLKPGPTTKFVVNEQVYADTLAARDQVIDLSKTKNLGAAFNLDLLEGNGKFNVLSPVNGPLGSVEWFFIDQIGYSADPWGWRTQRAVGFTGNMRNREFRRTREEGITPPWSAWSEVESTKPSFSAARSGMSQVVQTAKFTRIMSLNASSDNTASWDSANGWYVIPKDGLYLSTGAIRIADGAKLGSNVGIGIAAAEGDSELLFWKSVTGSRNTFDYVRPTSFAKGQQVRLFMYQETGGDVTIVNASLGLSLISG